MRKKKLNLPHSYDCDQSCDKKFGKKFRFTPRSGAFLLCSAPTHSQKFCSAPERSTLQL